MQLKFTKKGITSFLSTNPFSYAVELTAESPLFNSGFGCSCIHPLADCVKSALTLLLGIKNLCSSFWRKHCPNTGASFYTFIFLAPFLHFPRAGARRIACGQQRKQFHTITSLALCWKTIKNFTIRKERNAFFNRKVYNEQVNKQSRERQ